MKLLVFAHTPPPHHGQSVMVNLMLDGFGGDWRKRQPGTVCPGDDLGVQCYHVNARLSDDLGDIGGLRLAKIFRLIKYCVEAIWCRFRYGVTTFYYVPAPAKKSAILRDWMVMLLVRPWFSRTVFHWHAYGLGEWAGSTPGLGARLTKFLLKAADVSVVLTDFNRRDAAVFTPKKITVVPNGLSDPCPDFDATTLPDRQARRAQRTIFRVLFLAHCMREKGLFDTLDAVAQANAKLQRLNRPLRLQLTVAGDFVSQSERAEFTARIGQDDLRQDSGGAVVTYAGFLSDAAKDEALRSHDVLCFPTFYDGETFGLTILEAMAFGLPVVVSRWRGLPEILPAGWAGSASPHAIGELVEALLQVTDYEDFSTLRRRFLEHFTSGHFLRRMAEAVTSR